MRELLQLRQEEARLLGYANHAEVSLVPKMADSPQQVMDFLRDLARRARPYAERDLAELREFAASTLGLPDLQAWDLPFASEKLKEARYAFSDQEVKQFFTEPKVLEGLFRIIETLFEVSIRPDRAPVWHPSVRFFRIERAGQLIGQFYLDPYARNGKRLYTFDTGGPIAGGVITYDVKGKQYVAVASGHSGGSIPLTGSTTIVIFGL